MNAPLIIYPFRCPGYLWKRLTKRANRMQRSYAEQIRIYLERGLDQDEAAALAEKRMKQGIGR